MMSLLISRSSPFLSLLLSLSRFFFSLDISTAHVMKCFPCYFMWLWKWKIHVFIFSFMYVISSSLPRKVKKSDSWENRDELLPEIKRGGGSMPKPITHVGGDSKQTCRRKLKKERRAGPLTQHFRDTRGGGFWDEGKRHIRDDQSNRDFKERGKEGNHERWTNSLNDDNHAIHYKLIRSFKTATRDFGVSNDRPAPRMEGKGGREKLF